MFRFAALAVQRWVFPAETSALQVGQIFLGLDFLSVVTMGPPSGATLGFSNLLIFFLLIGVYFATWQIWQLSTEC